MVSQALRDTLRYYLDSDAERIESERQYRKLLKAKKHFLQQVDAGADLPEFLADLAERRNRHVDYSCHLLCIGGTGSHWIGSMLQDIAPIIFVSEVYLPNGFRKRLETLSTDEQEMFVDAVEILHMFAHHPERAKGHRIDTAPVVNSSHGLRQYKFQQQFRKDSRAVHLSRDPRDRTISIVYRKKDRPIDIADPEIALELRRAAKRSRSHLNHLRKTSPNLAEVYYENFLFDLRRSLIRLCGHFGLDHDSAALDAVIRSGTRITDVERTRMNPGASRRNWYADAPPDVLALMHGEIAEAAFMQNYLLCDCSGRKKIPASSYFEVRADIPAAEARFASVCGFEAGDDYWRDLPDSDTRIDGSGRLRLRHHAALQTMALDWIGQITDYCATRGDGVQVAELIARSTNLDALDIRGIEDLGPVLASLPKTLSCIWVDRDQQHAIRSAAARAAPKAEIRST